MTTASSFTGEKSTVIKRVMRALHAGFTGGVRELAIEVHSTHRTLEKVMHLLHIYGLARIVAWRFQVGPGGAIAQWSFGPGRHAKKSAGIGKNGPVIVERSRVAVRVIEYLKANDLSSQRQISLEIKSAYNAMPPLMRALRAEGMAHIAGWGRSTHEGKPHSPIPLYRAGKGIDMPRPAPISSTQASADRREALAKKYGKDAARRIIASRSNGGPDAIVIDGQTVWRRRPARSAEVTA